MSSSSASKLSQKLFLWFVCTFLYGLPFLFFQEFNTNSGSLFVESALGNVIEEGEFVIVRTHDSGTFVGSKQHIKVKESESDSSLSAANDGSDIGNGESVAAELEDGRIYYAFKGIPYAAKPLGNRRWKEPQPYDVKDSGPKDSTKYQSICSQWNSVKGEVVGSEDCLYLNIFTPRLFVSTQTRPSHSNQVNYSKFDDDPRETKRHLPVLLYVHDGDFISSSGNLAPGAEQAFMQQDIILVTFNYRLGVFGFLTTGTPSLPGNYGLLDQISVLKWLHKNVHRFGGNSNRITIFGNTLFLQLSPLTSGLFHNVILMQSTTTLAAAASPASTSAVLNTNPQSYFLQFANATSCPVTQELLESDPSKVQDVLDDCLRQKPLVELIQAQQSFYKLWRLPKLLTPTIDEGLNEVGDVLPRSVLDTLPTLGIPEESASESEPPPLMMGVSAYGEGLDLFYEFYESVQVDNTFNRQSTIRRLLRIKLCRYLEQLVGTQLAYNAKSFNGIWNYYFGAVPFNNESDTPDSSPSEIPQIFWSQLLQLFSDVSVYAPYWTLLQNMKQKQKESLKLFNYVFDPQVEFSEELLNYIRAKRANVGASSGMPERMPMEEEFYLFEATEEDPYHNEELSGILVNILVSFAAYENPKNAITKHNWTRWTKFGYNYNRRNQTMYYHIRQNVSQMQDNFKKQEAQFWLETVPQLYKMSYTVEELDDWPTLFWIFTSLTGILFLIVVSIIGYMFWSKYSEKY